MPRLPLFPGQRQVWSLAVRQRADASEQDLDNAIRAMFEAWWPLFPAPPSAPVRLDPEEFDGLQPLDYGRAPPLALRGPTRHVTIAFDVPAGSAESMRWPTHHADRRARIDPLCPMAEVDAMPMQVYEPRESEGDSPMAAPERPGDIPWDAGLGPVDVGKWRLLGGGALLLTGLVAASVVALALRPVRRW